MKLRLEKVGEETGLILPAEVLEKLHLEPGDGVIVTVGPEGTIVATPCLDDDEKAMRIARWAMKTYRNTLKELAK